MTAYGPRESIFSKLVTKENDYTQLLCNLMQRDGVFCELVLALFLDKNVTRLLKNARLSTQTHLPNGCGQPDLHIKTPTLHVIVEVKTESHRGRTTRQELIGKGRDYLSYLADQHKSGIEVALTFLVPHDWKFRQEMEDGITALQEEGTEKRVPVKQVFWEQLLGCLSKEGAQSETPLIEEFRLLLAKRFGPIHFDPEEGKSMFTPEFPMQSVLKLNALLEGVRKRAGNGATKLYSDKEEFGFYLKKGVRELLFVGYWRAFWDDGHRYPICFGIPDDDDAPKVAEAFRSAFRKAYKAEAISSQEWTMGWVPEKDFNSLDAVDEIWWKLQPIWKEVSEAAG
jgi:hypothetical protein